MKQKRLTLEELYNLPLSDIILIAVDDIEEAKKKGYNINMMAWGEKDTESCTGCFAGHCLLHYSRNVTALMNMNAFASAIGHALNAIRNGEIENAVLILQKPVTDDQQKGLDILQRWRKTRAWYSADSKRKWDNFLLHMTWIALELKALDL